MTLLKSGAGLAVAVAGLMIWGSAFVALYGILSIGCAFGWETRNLGPVDLLRGSLIAIWIVHLAMLGALFMWCRTRAHKAPSEENEGFMTEVSFALAIVSLVITLINYAPILGLSACL